MGEVYSLSRGELIVQECIQHGVTDFFIAPGSRSTALALATEHPKAQQHIFYDERSLGFSACGFAKGSGRIPAIITTSGSAVANLLPAIVEAFQDHVPILILTADRPFELHDTGANQTIDQSRIFSSYVTWSRTLPLSDSSVTDRVCRSVVSIAVFQAQSSCRPVHLNCAFREPFKQGDPVEIDSPYCTFNRIGDLPKNTTWVILAGDLSDQESDQVLAFAEEKMIMVVPDCMSSLRFKKHPLIKSDYLFIDEFDGDVSVLQFGKRVIDSPFVKLLRRQEARWYCITEQLPINNPDHLCRGVLLGDLSTSIDTLRQSLPNECSTLNMTVAKPVLKPELSQALIFRALEHLEPYSWVFLSNSTVIRTFNLHVSMSKKIDVYSNRGASGIDGNLSTAIGIAKATKERGVCFFGDLAFCYDMNALGGLDDSIPPLLLFVFNNGGGSIFKDLPIVDQVETDTFNRLFTTPHSFSSFHSIAAHFGCDYRAISKLEDLSHIWAEPLHRHTIVDVVLN